MLNILLITIIVVFIVDLSGIIEEISKFIWKILYPKVKYTGWLIPKPFSCSLCLSWWINLLYGLFIGLTVKLVAYIAILSFLTPVIKDIFILIRDLFIKLINYIYGKIN